MEISNKEIINRLQEHFLKSDPKVIARALANAMIDFNRMVHLENLSDGERDCLGERLMAIVNELQDFVKNGANDPLTLVNIESDVFYRY